MEHVQAIDSRTVRRIAAAAVVLAAGGLAWAAWGQTSATANQGGNDSVSIWITGCTLGSLRPCGCSGGQLGGLERRAALLHSDPFSHRLLLDTGGWIKQEQEQDLIKARILVRAFQLLDYDVVCLAAKDVQVAEALGLTAEMTAAGGVIAPEGSPVAVGLPKTFERSFDVAGQPLSVRVRAVDPQGLVTQLAGPTAGEPEGPGDVDVYVVDTSEGPPAELLSAGLSRATCIIYAADSDEPRLRSDPNANPLVFSIGRYGRHAVRLQVAAAGGQGASKVRFSVHAVSQDLPTDGDLMALYKDYQQIVAESGLLGQRAKVPLAGGLTYVGSPSCSRCHPYEYGKASSQRHSQAYATLEKAGSHLDPECVICHVVGLDYEEGFVSARQTPELTGVGCETCHGPGAEHVRTGGKAVTCGPRLSCLSCHNPEHSGQYAGHEKEFLEKMRHWKELRRPALVQP